MMSLKQLFPTIACLPEAKGNHAWNRITSSRTLTSFKYMIYTNNKTLLIKAENQENHTQSTMGSLEIHQMAGPHRTPPLHAGCRDLHWMPYSPHQTPDVRDWHPNLCHTPWVLLDVPSSTPDILVLLSLLENVQKHIQTGESL